MPSWCPFGTGLSAFDFCLQGAISPKVSTTSLFTPATQSMLSFMWQKDTCAVALFVARALDSMGVADM